MTTYVHIRIIHTERHTLHSTTLYGVFDNFVPKPYSDDFEDIRKVNTSQ